MGTRDIASVLRQQPPLCSTSYRTAFARVTGGEKCAARNCSLSQPKAGPPNRAHWQDLEDKYRNQQANRLQARPCFHEQPLDRRKDSTYYNPQTKKKLKTMKRPTVFVVLSAATFDRISYKGITKANTAAMPVVNMLLQSAVSDEAEFRMFFVITRMLFWITRMCANN